MTWYPKKIKNPPAEIGSINFFCGIVPVKLLNKNPNSRSKKFPNIPQARQIYPIRAGVRHITRFAYEALSDFKNKWKKGDWILLPPGLVFKKVSPRYLNSSNESTQMKLEELRKEGYL
jgi:hypothetical protein